MTISNFDKIHPLPGGILDDSNAASRDNADMLALPDFSTLSPQLGKNPTVGSWVGLCFLGPIAGAMPGYAVVRRKGTTGKGGKMRVPLFDCPDG